MSQKPKILLQLDSDETSSSFDSIVAVDAGVDHLLSYGNVSVENVVPIVHGAMFTRGGSDLNHTAIFVGGSDIQAGEQILKTIEQCFFSTVRVSVLLDSGGANTTAAAAVLSAKQHIDLDSCSAIVFGGTGSVGRRVAHLLARDGSDVLLASRVLSRAEEVCSDLSDKFNDASISAVETLDDEEISAALESVDLVIAAGAAGVQLLNEVQFESAPKIRVAIDLNAVPPSGIEGIGVTDKGSQMGDRILYGAVGVGGLKMKIHRQAINRLFESNDAVLDIDQIYDLGKSLLK